MFFGVLFSGFNEVNGTDIRTRKFGSGHQRNVPSPPFLPYRSQETERGTPYNLKKDCIRVDMLFLWKKIQRRMS